MHFFIYLNFVDFFQYNPFIDALTGKWYNTDYI